MLDAALRFGDKPFKPELYQQALDYQALVKGRVGYLEATLRSGRRARAARRQAVVRRARARRRCACSPASTSLVGEQQGYLTASRRVVVAGGETVDRDR